MGISMNSMKATTIHYKNHLRFRTDNNDWSNWETKSTYPHAIFYITDLILKDINVFQCGDKNQGFMDAKQALHHITSLISNYSD